MVARLLLLLFAVLIVGSTTAQAQCSGFTTNPADFNTLTPIVLLPEAGFGAPQPLVRGGVEYTGGSLQIGTTCPGAFGTLSMCDFSGPVTGIPSVGTMLFRYGMDYWADVGINAFKMEVELESGAISNFTATSNSGFVGYCAPADDPIVRIAVEGHDGAATAIYHDVQAPLPSENSSWGKIKALFN